VSRTIRLTSTVDRSPVSRCDTWRRFLTRATIRRPSARTVARRLRTGFADRFDLQEHLDVADDAGERVVDLVRRPAEHASERRELLGLFSLSTRSRSLPGALQDRLFVPLQRFQ